MAELLALAVIGVGTYAMRAVFLVTAAARWSTAPRSWSACPRRKAHADLPGLSVAYRIDTR